MLDKIYNNKKVIIIVLIIFIIIILVFFNNKEEVEIIQEIEEDVIEKNDVEEINKIIVHITGCVTNPGVIEIEEGARIVDAIELAGGITEEADISKVNLAYIIKDAQKIYIPSIYDQNNIEYITTQNGDNVIIEDNKKGENRMININTAMQTELETLPGIGPSTALKIINYREDNGKFNSIEEIKQVPGIGDSKFSNIKDMIEV